MFFFGGGDFQRFLLYFVRIYNWVTGSDGLNSLFHAETNPMNSKVAVRMSHENNFKKLHNKSVEINV